MDSTAATTLALLDRELAAYLIGQFARLESTEVAYHDALSAQESLGLRSTLSLVWDPGLSKPRPDVIPEQVADKLADHGDRVVDILTTAHRTPWPDLKAFPDLTDMHAAWLTTLDMAIETGIPFWCDDRVLGSLATSLGIPTFGTVDLLLELMHRDMVGQQLVEAAEAVLISNYYVDLGFSLDVMTLAASIDQWEPRGAAFALTRSFTWADPEPVAQFLLTALDHQLDRAPDDIRGWIACAAVGLVRDHEKQADASNNLRFLLARLVTQPWMRPDRFPAVLSGVRQGISERPDVNDPLFEVLNGLHTNLVRQYGHGVAAQLLLALVKHADAEDRRVAVEVILRTK